MEKSRTSFLELDRRAVPSRQPGQGQDGDSKERARKFSERAAAIEKLRQARIIGAAAVEPKKVRKKAKPSV